MAAVGQVPVLRRGAREARQQLVEQVRLHRQPGGLPGKPPGQARWRARGLLAPLRVDVAPPPLPEPEVEEADQQREREAGPRAEPGRDRRAGDGHPAPHRRPARVDRRGLPRRPARLGRRGPGEDPECARRLDRTAQRARDLAGGIEHPGGVVAHADADPGRADGHPHPLAIPLLHLRPPSDRLVDGHVDEVERAAVRVRLVVGQPQVVPGELDAERLLLRLAPLPVGGPQISAGQPPAVERRQRRAVDEGVGAAEEYRQEHRHPERGEVARWV